MGDDSKRDQREKQSTEIGVRSLRTEDGRLTSEELSSVLLAFMKESPVVGWIKDDEFRYRYVNQAFETVFSSSDLLGKEDYSFLPKDTADVLRQNDLAVQDSSDAIRTIEDVAGEDGQTRRWLVNKFPIENVAGKSWLGGLASDVTEWMAAEDELRRSEENYRRLLEASPFCIHQIDREGRIISINKSGLKMVGLKSPDGILGMPYLEFVSAEDKNRIAENMRRAFKGEYSQFEFVSPNGQYFRSNFTPIHEDDHSITSLLGITEDITEQKHAEDRIRASEERHRLVVAAARDPIWEIDLQTGVVWWNDTHDRMFGIRPEEVGDSWDWWTSRIRESERQSVSDSLKNTLEDTDAEHWAADYHFRSRFGNELFIQDRAIISRDENGVALRIVGTMRDQTNAMKAMQERQRLLAEVQEAQRLESLGVLAGGIAHDFNNLLTVMLCNISLLQMRHQTASQETEILSELEGAVDSASEICQQILSYAGKGHFVVKPTCLRRLVQDTAKLLKVSVGKHAEFALELELETAPVMCDEAQITQLIMNLVINAAESIGEKAGKVSIRLSEIPYERKLIDACQIKPSHTGDAFTCLEVSDDGSGMSARTLAQIFDPFFTTKSTGRGLGLAAVRGIIRRHNGGLLVTSEKDRGTSFRVLLPVTNTPIEDSTVSDGETNLLTQTPESDWVLVIDDDDKVLRTTRRVLEERGFHTQIATDGQQATSLLRLNPRSYQLIVLNMNMPRMDGAKTLKQLRSITPSVPIVMTSGFGEDECRERLTGLAFDGYIQKPYSPEELLHCVTNVLSEHCAPKLG